MKRIAPSVMKAQENLPDCSSILTILNGSGSAPLRQSPVVRLRLRPRSLSLEYEKFSCMTLLGRHIPQGALSGFTAQLT